MNSEHTERSCEHYVQIDEKKCNGCVLCMKACPTKAIRVKNNRVARIEGVCIDCGECIRVCPRGAIKAITTGSGDSRFSPYTVISASPVLYGQFGEDVMPNDILLALRRVFQYVYDQAYMHELCNVATELYIQENRGKEEAVWPLISSVCPVVNRLIAYRFPSLLNHIIPIIPPREIAARELKKRLYGKGQLKTKDLGVYHVTPCSAKMMSINEPMFSERSYLDGALGINEVYDLVRKNLSDEGEDVMLLRSGGVGISWSISGGEISGLDEGTYLAVSGFEKIILYLEKIEMGLFNDIEYFEFRACAEGCIGGPLTVADRYEAKRTIQRMARMLGQEKRLRFAKAQKAYKEGWFFSEVEKKPLSREKKPLSIAEAIRRQERVEEFVKKLPGKECSMCGAPDCRTFAEDVVDGKASIEDCVFLGWEKKQGEQIQ
ncbi:MAG: [Fe-Fe] hydrogenase large subunit C-terminal domain-containing protein [Deltaproteobacteria bacterium]